MDKCWVCLKRLRPRQEALLCDGCGCRQHRTCETGMTREDYRRAVREGRAVNWRCATCSSAQDVSVEDHPPDQVQALVEDVANDISEKDSLNNSAVCSIEDQPSDRTQALVEDVANDISEKDSLSNSADCSTEDHPSDQVQALVENITYEKVCASSQRGKQKLMDSRCYSYTFKRETNVGVHWRCAVRNKTVNCGMTIKEVNNVFIRGPNEHSHPPETCPVTTSKVSKLIKNKAMEDVFRPALEIVEEVMLENIDPTIPTASLPAPVNLARQANRKRRTNRPAEPIDLTFEISEEHVPPNFL
ncbi:hypothetical protein Pcinc_007158 [Petrolisthes cinctipes]|uniref:FLYWCH-type domain-containing protein n=1 Tax=Petrolisthes cinctipes TaxID=88211 RepID=A0AAE1GFT1_PETCI|nr:hypothetical protein Pcinc_007158 [Petrolisthes cinctipes]